MDKKIIVAGSILVDRIHAIDAYPHAGELVQVRSVRRAAGGLVPNVGRDLRLLDPSIPVLAAGKVGRDDDGEFVRAELAAAGIELSLSFCEDDATSFTDVMSVPGGERTFFTYPGASASWGWDDFPFDRINAGDLVLLGYFLLLGRIDAGDGLKILAELKRRGAETAIDLVTENSDRYGLIRPCLPFVDNLIVNEAEAARLAGHGGDSLALAAELLAGGVRKRVVIHEPSRGVCVSSAGAVARASFRLPDGFIRDKTGAGDAYCAGVLSGIFEGAADAELLRRGRLAAAGALSACGATAGVRNWRELEERTRSLAADAGHFTD